MVTRGKSPVLSTDEALQFLDAIEHGTLVGLRDRALIGLRCYTFARVSATVGMHAEDHFQHGKRRWIRPHENGGERHEEEVGPAGKGRKVRRPRIDGHSCCVGYAAAAGSGGATLGVRSEGPRVEIRSA